MNENMWVLAWSPLLWLWLALGGVAWLLGRLGLLPESWVAAVNRSLLPFAVGAGATCLFGMIVGGGFFTLLGMATNRDWSWGDAIAHGVLNGYLYGWLWSNGVGVVAVARFWHRRGRSSGAAMVATA